MQLDRSGPPKHCRGCDPVIRDQSHLQTFNDSYIYGLLFINIPWHINQCLTDYLSISARCRQPMYGSTFFLAFVHCAR